MHFFFTELIIYYKVLGQISYESISDIQKVHFR